MKTMRKGYGLKQGQGYKNLMPMDSHIHSLSAKGVGTKVLALERVAYGKKSTPEKDREYKIQFYGSPVGTIKEWKQFAKKQGVDKIHINENDGTDRYVDIDAKGKIPLHKVFEDKNGKKFVFVKSSKGKIQKRYLYEGENELNAKGKKADKEPEYKIDWFADITNSGLPDYKKPKDIHLTKREKKIAVGNLVGADLGFVIGGALGGLGGMVVGVPVGVIAGNLAGKKVAGKQTGRPLKYKQKGFFNKLLSTRESRLKYTEQMRKKK